MVRAVTTERTPVPNDRVHHDRSAIGRRQTAQRPPVATALAFARADATSQLIAALCGTEVARSSDAVARLCALHLCRQFRRGIGLRLVPLHGREGQPSLSCGRPQDPERFQPSLSRTHPSLIRSI